MTDGDLPMLGDVLTMPEHQRDDDRRWLVLYPDDYDNHIADAEGNLAVLLGNEQAGEVLRLAANILADTSHRDADGEDVIRDMIEALENQLADSDGGDE
jgi:poly(3-hydroxybutyrate) depolymerase